MRRPGPLQPLPLLLLVPLLPAPLAGQTTDLVLEADLVLESETFTNVVDIAADSAQVYVLDLGAKSVLVFDADGEPVRAMGREGRGPGELSHASRLGWLGDTLWVRDLSNARFVFFHDGEPAGTVRLAAAAQPAGADLPGPVVGEWLLADGSVLAAPMAGMNVLATGDVDTIPYFTMDRDGRVGSRLFGRDVRNEILRIAVPGDRGRGLYQPQPLAPGALVTATSTGDALYVVDRSEYRIQRRSPDGTVLWSERFGHEEREADEAADAEMRRLIEVMEGFAPRVGMSETAFHEALEEGFHVPEKLPPVSAVVTGRDGWLWVRREAGGADTYAWDLISPDGEREHSSRLPRGFRALRGERDHVWGTEWDALGVPRVVRYRVKRGS